MQTNAYVSSNETRKTELDEQIADLNAEIRNAGETLRKLKSASAEARTLKRAIARLEEQRDELKAQMPALLFSEAGALSDLEADLNDAIAEWERRKAKWIADATTNPAYAVRNAQDIITQQTYAEQAMLLQSQWQALAAEEGRTLAAFRKAYDQVARARKRDMMSKLTASHSTCAFHNAVEHQQGCALNEYGQYYNHVGERLAWYEDAIVRMARID